MMLITWQVLLMLCRLTVAHKFNNFLDIFIHLGAYILQWDNNRTNKQPIWRVIHFFFCLVTVCRGTSWSSARTRWTLWSCKLSACWMNWTRNSTTTSWGVGSGTAGTFRSWAKLSPTTLPSSRPSNLSVSAYKGWGGVGNFKLTYFKRVKVLLPLLWGFSPQLVVTRDYILDFWIHMPSLDLYFHLLPTSYFLFRCKH